jgi:hypothetical protein
MVNGAQLAVIAGAAIVAGALSLFPPQLEVTRVLVPAGDGRTTAVVVERPVGRPDGAGEYRRDTTRLLAECALVAAVASVLVALAANRPVTPPAGATPPDPTP